MKKFIFFILLFWIVLSRAQAETVNLIKDTFDNTYTYYYDDELDRSRYLIASKYIFGNNVAYCLEMGKPIDSFVYNINNSFDGININKNDLEYIKFISYYGYDYPGHNTDKYYMATQELIWRRLGEPSMSWTIGLTPNNYYDLSKEKDEIERLIKQHDMTPSFDGTALQHVLGEEKILVDNNGVLSLYESLDENVIIDGNRLIIKESFSGNEIILRRQNYNSKSFLLYTFGSSQKMMSVGMLDMPSISIKVNVMGGSVTINKLDSENKNDVSRGNATLDGAIYGLYDYDGVLIDTFITGKKEMISNLTLGKYYVKEIKPSNGYLLDNNRYDFEIAKNNLDINLTLYEDVIKRKIDIFKVFASDETGPLVGEPNIRFDVYDESNILIDSIVTDNDGYASIILPYGVYTFKQVNSTSGYYKVDDFIINVNVYDERPIYKLLSNSEIKAKVKVIKKDIDTLDNIVNSNIKFKIFDVDKNEYVYFKLNYPESKIIDTFYVNEDGTFITPYELNSGEYILYEVDDMMDGYLYNSEGVSFVIGDESSFINDNLEGMILEIPFYNKRVKGNINIVKYGEEIVYKDDSYYYNNILLKDVLFNLYSYNDIYENGRLIYTADELVYECTTNDRGECLMDSLPLGKYYLKEISSSNNNVISDDIYYIDIDYKDQYTDIISYDLVVNNYIDKGKLVVNKYETGTSFGIENTLIEVHDSYGNIVYKGYTDSEGKIVIMDLPYGDYCISEVEASTGYRLLEDNIYFKIDDKETVIDIYNERIVVPNTGIDIGVNNIIIILFIVLAFVLIIIFFENKKVVILCVCVILVSFGYFGLYFYRYYSDNSNNKNAIEAYMNNDIDNLSNDRYSYNSILEIPSIGLKRGILDISSEYNDAKYNIELVKKDDDVIVLAAHNGNSYNSYFGKLVNLELGDVINYYENGKVYEYVYSENYEIRKNGYADIYRKNGVKTIVLCTCKDDSSDGQVIFIGYLNMIREF